MLVKQRKQQMVNCMNLNQNSIQLPKPRAQLFSYIATRTANNYAEIQASRKLQIKLLCQLDQHHAKNMRRKLMIAAQLALYLRLKEQQPKSNNQVYLCTLTNCSTKKRVTVTSTPSILCLKLKTHGQDYLSVESITNENRKLFLFKVVKGSHIIVTDRNLCKGRDRYELACEKMLNAFLFERAKSQMLHTNNYCIYTKTKKATDPIGGMD